MKCLHMKGFILLKIWCWDIQAQHLQETLEACGIFGFCLNHLPEGTVKATTGCSLIWNHAKGFIHYPWRQDTAQGSRVERNLLGSGRAVYLGVKLSLRRFALFCTWDTQGKKAVGAAGCAWCVRTGVWLEDSAGRVNSDSLQHHWPGRYASASPCTCHMLCTTSQSRECEMKL